jgi:hypothetical protein
MEGARDFLQEAKKMIDEVTEYSQFASKVMQSDKPVILDCYAE